MDVADGRRPRGRIPDIGPQVHGRRAAERLREGLFDVGFEASLTDDPGEPVPQLFELLVSEMPIDLCPELLFIH